MSTVYQVGIANSPQPDDDCFVDEERAIDRAREMVRRWVGEPICIWRNSEPVLLLFLGCEWRTRE